MKRYLIAILACFMFTFEGVAPAYAANTLSTSNATLLAKPVSAVASRSANVAPGDTAKVIQRADQMIAVRLSALSQLSTRVQNDKRLSSDEKTALNTDIQSDISGLTALKAKIDSENDATAIRNDAKTIISDYKIFAIFEPKMRMLIILNNLQKPLTTLQAMVPQLQSLVDTLNSQGKDTTELTSILTDINTQLSDVNATITADITALEAVTPQSTNYQATFSKVKSDIQTIRTSDFTKVRADIEKLRVAFRQVIASNSTNPTASGSAVQSNSLNASNSAVPAIPVKPVAVP